MDSFLAASHGYGHKQGDLQSIEAAKMDRDAVRDAENMLAHAVSAGVETPGACPTML